MPGGLRSAEDARVLQDWGTHDDRQAERTRAVVEIWRLLAEREMPGTDLVAEDATAAGVVFGDGVGDVTASLRERFRALIEADAGFGLRLQRAIVAPGGEVVCIGVARSPGSAWLIAVVNEFRGAVVSHATAYQDVGDALASVRLQGTGPAVAVP